MTPLLLLAVPSTVALVCVLALAVSVLVRTLQGERWELPLNALATGGAPLPLSPERLAETGWSARLPVQASFPVAGGEAPLGEALPA